MASLTEIAPDSPMHWLGRTATGQMPAPCDRSSPPDADLNVQKRSKNASLRQSAAVSAAVPGTDGSSLGEPLSARTVIRLRQSALPADSASAQRITTMENADVDAMIIALAAVVRAYTREAARQKKFVHDGGANFDEQKHPLDKTSAWKLVPRASLVESFIREVVLALELDESSLVISLILLERAMGANPTPLVLSARTWRPSLLMAIVIASKTIYDEKVFLADYRTQLPYLNLEQASVQERDFLTLIGFNTNVRRGQYAKYYYALEDVSRCQWADGDGEEND